MIVGVRLFESAFSRPKVNLIGALEALPIGGAFLALKAARFGVGAAPVNPAGIAVGSIALALDRLLALVVDAEHP